MSENVSGIDPKTLKAMIDRRIKYLAAGRKGVRRMSEAALCERIREIPLPERLKRSREMIGQMCRQGRPPKMTIPVQWDDEDLFISTTLADALTALRDQEARGSGSEKI